MPYPLIKPLLTTPYISYFRLSQYQRKWSGGSFFCDLPGFSFPTVLPSDSLIGVTSAAVPVKNASSAI